MIRPILHQILYSPVLFFGSFFLLRAGLWIPIERFWRARSIEYRRVAPRDFGAQLFHVFLVVPVVIYLYHLMVVNTSFPTVTARLPLSVRVAIYFVVSDLGYYFAHRLMHTSPLWRTHKWHHSPHYMYWLAGCRATIPHQFLVTAPYILAAPILYPAPLWVYTANGIFSYLAVDWMHLNVPWGSKALEWFLVTPRYHHVHHSSNPQHYNFNMGNVFTFWDRLFGTFVDPDTLERKNMAFGIDDAPPPVRLIAGL